MHRTRSLPPGDVVSMGTEKPPSDAVLVIRDSPAFTAPPVSFEPVAGWWFSKL